MNDVEHEIPTANTHYISTIARLEAELAQQQKTVENLRAGGHVCRDAEKQLERFKIALALLKTKWRTSFPRGPDHDLGKPFLTLTVTVSTFAPSGALLGSSRIALMPDLSQSSARIAVSSPRFPSWMVSNSTVMFLTTFIYGQLPNLVSVPAWVPVQINPVS